MSLEYPTIFEAHVHCLVVLTVIESSYAGQNKLTSCAPPLAKYNSGLKDTQEGAVFCSYPDPP